LASNIFLWYLPAAALASHLIVPRFEPRMRSQVLWLVLAPYALFYGNVMTADCPKPPINTTNVFLEKSITIQRDMAIAFTAFAALILAASSFYFTRSTQAKFPLTLFLVGAVGLLASGFGRISEDADCSYQTYNNTSFGSLLVALCSMLVVLAGFSAVFKFVSCETTPFQVVADLAMFVTTGVLISQILYISQNQGCLGNVREATSDKGAAFTTILVAGWMGSIFPIIPEDEGGKSPRYSYFVNRDE
jgi:hypothetical protein